MRAFFPLTARLILSAAIAAAAPSAAEESPHLSRDPEIRKARQLIKDGRYRTALDILRPLKNYSARPDITDILFLTGLAGIRASEQAENKEKNALLNEAVSALRTILISRPELWRVRLELAYALFLQEKDDLARAHFETALAGNPHPALAANARRILYKIRARKKWSGIFSVNVEQNDNINSGANADVVYLFGLPFRLDEESRPRSETGLSFAGGGEYQHPLGENFRWRLGADAVRSEFRGGDFDQSYVALRSGPRALFGRRGEASLQAFFGRRWAHSRLADEFGLRLEARRRIGSRAGINGRAQWRKTRERRAGFADAADVDYFFGGDWLFTPLLQGNAGIGTSATRPDRSGRTRDVRARIGAGAILPRGWTFGADGEWTRRRFAGNAAFSAQQREDRRRIFRLFALNRGLLFFGFSPQISVSRELQDSNSVFHAYRRTRAGLRMIRQF